MRGVHRALRAFGRLSVTVVPSVVFYETLRGQTAHLVQLQAGVETSQ